MFLYYKWSNIKKTKNKKCICKCVLNGIVEYCRKINALNGYPVRYQCILYNRNKNLKKKRMIVYGKQQKLKSDGISSS